MVPYTDPDQGDSGIREFHVCDRIPRGGIISVPAYAGSAVATTDHDAVLGMPEKQARHRELHIRDFLYEP